MHNGHVHPSTTYTHTTCLELSLAAIDEVVQFCNVLNPWYNLLQCLESHMGMSNMKLNMMWREAVESFDDYD